MLKDTFQDNHETDFATQVKDELVCVNRVSNIEGKLKLAHLRVIIILMQYLQPALRHKITFRRISGAVPERLLPPKSEMALDGCHRIITVPVSASIRMKEEELIFSGSSVQNGEVFAQTPVVIKHNIKTTERNFFMIIPFRNQLSKKFTIILPFSGETVMDLYGISK